MSPAYAGQLKCKSNRSLDTQDFRRLETVLKQIVIKGDQINPPQDACVNNFGARSIVTTVPGRSGDGTRDWWTYVCERKAIQWVCEPGTHHFTSKFNAPVAGKTKEIYLTLTGSLPLEKARDLAVEVAELRISSPNPPLECGSHKLEYPYEWERRTEIVRKLREIPVNIFSAPDGAIEIEVNQDGMTYVLAPNEGVDPTVDSAARFCWKAVVTVS